MLVSLVGAPDCTLVYWNRSTGKMCNSVLVSQTSPMTRCSLNPYGSMTEPTACVSGRESIYLYRLYPNNTRPFLLKEYKKPGLHFVSHLWFKDQYAHETVIAATDKGDLFIFRSDGKDHVCRLEVSPGNTGIISYL
jgi:hypothetical protein